MVDGGDESNVAPGEVFGVVSTALSDEIARGSGLPVLLCANPASSLPEPCMTDDQGTQTTASLPHAAAPDVDGKSTTQANQLAVETATTQLYQLLLAQNAEVSKHVLIWAQQERHPSSASLGLSKCGELSTELKHIATLLQAGLGDDARDVEQSILQNLTDLDANRHVLDKVQRIVSCSLRENAATPREEEPAQPSINER